MSGARAVTERNGLLAVARYVVSDWFSDWQEFDHQNDDGIDGLILLRRKVLNPEHAKNKHVDAYKRRATGVLIHVQVKAGRGYLNIAENRPDTIGVKLGAKYIEEHRPRWDALLDPVILVYVDTDEKRQNPRAWWADLKDDRSYSSENRQIVAIPKRQTFGPEAKGHVRRLAGTATDDARLPLIELGRPEANIFPLSKSVKKAAREFYQDWRGTSAISRTNPKLGEVTVSRVGWRHLTRRGRRTERVVQSLMLLPVARRATAEATSLTRLGRVLVASRADGSTEVRDYVGVRVRVRFPQRHESVVQIVYRRFRRIDAQRNLLEQRVWFFSVYEIRRSRGEQRAAART